MQSRHILLTTIGSYGDLHPMIALGLELKRRGHRVTVATTSMYADKLRATGLAYHRLRPDLDTEDPELVRKLMDAKDGPEYLVRHLFMPHLREMFEDLTEVARDADFMLAGEVVYAAPLVGEELGIPWATALLAPLSLFSAYDPPVLPFAPATRYLHGAPPALHRALFALGRRAVANWCTPVAQLRRELGLRPGGNPLFEGKYAPTRNLALFSSHFAAPQPDWPPHTLQPGFVFYDQDQHGVHAPPGLREFLDAGEPPVVFTLGSAAVRDARDFFVESAAAARALKRRALLILGENPPPTTGPEIACFNYAPYSQVFTRAAAVVHQGGIGTTAQALRAGAPQLVVPFGFDQPDNGVRIERLGVGRTLPRARYNASRAAQLLRSMLDDPGYAKRGQRMARMLAGEHGLSVACDVIEAAAQGLV